MTQAGFSSVTPRLASAVTICPRVHSVGGGIERAAVSSITWPKVEVAAVVVGAVVAVMLRQAEIRSERGMGKEEATKYPFK